MEAETSERGDAPQYEPKYMKPEPIDTSHFDPMVQDKIKVYEA
jgi:hypothetical protein